MRHQLSLITLALVCFTNTAHAQLHGPEQDCISAFPVCQMVYVQDSFYQDQGAYEDINAGNSCLINGEVNSVWYTFTVSTSGTLEFFIAPHAPQDYDFALYDLTGHTCADIFNGGLEVRCNYSSMTVDTIGLRTGYNDVSAGSSGSPFLAPLQVQAGETYALLVDKFNSDPVGYTLDFSASTAGLLDNARPQIDTIFMPTCGNPNIITVQFSEPIQCSTLGNNFTISGPTSVDATIVNCPGGFSRYVELILSPLPLANANYTLHFNPNDTTVIEDGCGTTFALGLQTFPFHTAAEWISADFIYTCNGRTFTFTNTSQGDSLSYYWIFGDGTIASTEDATHLFPSQDYFTVSLIAQNASCSDTTSERIIAITSFEADFTMSPDSPRVNATVTFHESEHLASVTLWTVDGVIVPTPLFLLSLQHVFTTAGTHEVCVTSQRDCYADSICKTITVYPSTGIGALQQDVFEVFPNPAGNNTQVKLHRPIGTQCEAILYDALGQRVAAYPFTAQTIEIDLSSLTSGVYLLKVSSKDFSAMQRIVKL